MRGKKDKRRDREDERERESNSNLGQLVADRKRKTIAGLSWNPGHPRILYPFGFYTVKS